MSMPVIIGIAISVLSLVISATTLWITLLHRGRLAMTMPSIVFFGFDDIPRPTAKVFLRTLLYSTSTKGQVVEAMYVKLRRHQGGRCTFSFWGYDEGSRLVAGSGLYVSRAGVSANHHFVQSAQEMSYSFQEGDYTVDVFARLAGRRKAVHLAKFQVNLSSANAHALKGHNGILFERSPETQEYLGRINADRELPKPVPQC
jgi:hypothetical protein